MIWCLDARIDTGCKASYRMLCGSILRIDVHDPWSEAVVATPGGHKWLIHCVQTLSCNKQRVYTGWLLYIHTHIHTHTYTHTHTCTHVGSSIIASHAYTQAHLYWLWLCRCTPWRARTRITIGNGRRLVCIPQIQAAAFYNLLLLLTWSIRICRQHYCMLIKKLVCIECGRSLKKNKAVY